MWQMLLMLHELLRCALPMPAPTPSPLPSQNALEEMSHVAGEWRMSWRSSSCPSWRLPVSGQSGAVGRRWLAGTEGRAQQCCQPPASAQLQKHTNRYTKRQRVGEGRGWTRAACCIAAGNSPGNGMGNTCLIYIFIAVLILRHWESWKVVKFCVSNMYMECIKIKLQ